jgi:hypothetical protein
MQHRYRHAATASWWFAICTWLSKYRIFMIT